MRVLRQLPLRKKLFLILLLALIPSNFWTEFVTVPEKYGYYKQSFFFKAAPGSEASPLKRYLENVRVAGYVTDYKVADGISPWIVPPLMHRYQRLQYTLSPVMLDMKNPFTHEVVIFQCHTRNCEASDAQRLGLKEITRVEKQGLVLMAKGDL